MSNIEYETPDTQGIRWPKETPRGYTKQGKQKGDKADTKWKHLWCHERAQLCRELGITDLEQIRQLMNEPRLPVVIRQKLIENQKAKETQQQSTQEPIV